MQQDFNFSRAIHTITALPVVRYGHKSSDPLAVYPGDVAALSIETDQLYVGFSASSIFIRSSTVTSLFLISLTIRPWRITMNRSATE
jgi:hypothetical protein